MGNKQADFFFFPWKLIREWPDLSVNYMYVHKMRAEWKSIRYAFKPLGAGVDTEGLMHLFSQTALLALDFCYNYKASLETSCAVAFLPKHPEDPEKLDCHLQETNDNDPLGCNVQKKCMLLWDCLCKGFFCSQFRQRRETGYHINKRKEILTRVQKDPCHFRKTILWDWVKLNVSGKKVSWCIRERIWLNS